jgi:hypothetical protein
MKRSSDPSLPRFYGVFDLFALNDDLVVGAFEVGTVTVSVDIAGTLCNDPRVAAHGLLVNKGVVHKIDTVSDPFAVTEPQINPTIYDHIVYSPVLTVLSAAFVRERLEPRILRLDSLCSRLRSL